MDGVERLRGPLWALSLRESQAHAQRLIRPEDQTANQFALTLPRHFPSQSAAHRPDQRARCSIRSRWRRGQLSLWRSLLGMPLVHAYLTLFRIRLLSKKRLATNRP